MITLTAEALITYQCTLSDSDEELVRDYMEENGVDVEEAIESLKSTCQINIYDNSYEVDCHTQEISEIEIED